MHIVYIVPSLLAKGPVNVACDLITEFTSNGHKCYLIYFDNYKSEINPNCQIYNISDIDAIPWNIINVAHAHGYRPTKLLGKIKKLNPSILCVSTLHNYMFEDFKYEYGNLKGFIAGNIYLYYMNRYADKIICLSNHAFDYYSRYVNKDRLYVAYNSRIMNENGISNEEYNVLNKFKSPGNVILGTISVLTHRKGIDILLKALILLPDNYKLIIIGDGHERNILQQFVDNNNLDDRVLFIGSKDNAYRFHHIFNIYVLPSRSEGFPLSLLEASSMGSQIVCSDLPVIKEVFSDKINVLLFESGNSIDLYEKILEMSKFTDLGENAKYLFNNLLSPKCQYLRHCEIYENTDLSPVDNLCRTTKITHKV